MKVISPTQSNAHAEERAATSQEVFDVAACKRHVESLVRHDELERALLVLDNVPAYYREHPLPELEDLKRDVLRAAWTTRLCVDATSDALLTPEQSLVCVKGLLRGVILDSEVERSNALGEVPHIVDLGPGPYQMAFGLLGAGRKFTYWDLGVNFDARHEARAKLGDVLRAEPPEGSKIIFLALEVIEHMHEPRDIAIEALRSCGRYPDVVMMSTPYCTYHPIPMDQDWRTWNIEHLRAYTPREFQEAAAKVFPGYNWESFMLENKMEQPMSLIGRLKTGEADGS